MILILLHAITTLVIKGIVDIFIIRKFLSGTK
jgi:hypothetical protein